MADLPDHWPPDEPSEPKALTVPMFPLPNIYLFPGTFMPLHIFEPRYRQMVEDELDRQGRIVMANVVEDAAADLSGAPPVHPIAGLGEIAQFRRVEDGRFLLWLVGLCRVRVREVASSRLYRMVEAEIVHEIPPAEEEDQEYRRDVREAISRRTRAELGGENLPLGIMVDTLLQCLQLPQSVKQPLFSEPDISRRAERALWEHARSPLPEIP